ncbi:LacI family transcriptional regulator [Crenobacter caeni]|uniref:LacI family transcriptional regulator n=1 Tax=Crenobacter caeni TaxID=2705474 RepID=A0A6B2KTD1_9NEIS|nr:LacI family transcriptional regulator [Crenobacter caeni]
MWFTRGSGWRTTCACIRADGYREAAEVAGLHAPHIINIPGSEERIVQAAGTAIAADTAIDGIICSNDWAALGVLF